MNKVAHLLAVRDDARRRGDRGVERATTADLARLGHYDVLEPARDTLPAPNPGMETTAVQAPERAVPAKPAKRRAPRPRCEHGRIADRCVECKDDAV